ncbi:hypothetical protein EG829_11810 [bacterium]|nr:hypothetical protein [bacterium]
MRPRSLMITFSAVVALVFLFLVVNSTYAQRGGAGRGGGGASGFSRGGSAPSGSFSDVGRSASSAQSSAASRQQTSTTNQAQRQSARSQNVQTRQQAATSRTDTRAEAYDDDRHNQPGLWDNPGAVAAAGYVAGRTAAASAPVLVEPPCSATVNTVDDVTYYSCGASSYTQSYAGGSVVYVETAPPPGY